MPPQTLPAAAAIAEPAPLAARPRPIADRAAKAVKLSILMPAYNEQETIGPAVARVLGTELPCDFELIIVDDGSTDATPAILGELRHPRARVITHPRNVGKGAALRTAGTAASGTHLVPFDADLEYDPRDLAAVLAPVVDGRCEVVFGTRLFGVNTRYQSYRQAMGNRALTCVANVLFDSYLSDMHSCVKVLPVDLFRDIELSEDGFGLDTEITAKLLRRGIRPFEVPISYHSRSFDHGKKITWRDGIECLQVLTRTRFSRELPQVDPPAGRLKVAGGPVWALSSSRRPRIPSSQTSPPAVDAGAKRIDC